MKGSGRRRMILSGRGDGMATTKQGMGDTKECRLCPYSSVSFLPSLFMFSMIC